MSVPPMTSGELPANRYVRPAAVVAPSLEAHPQRVWAAWQISVDRKLRELGNVLENWDSYGGSPVSAEAIRVARELVFDLAGIPGLASPLVAASPEGSVGLAWTSGDVSLEVEIRDDGEATWTWVGTDPDRDRHGRVTSLAPFVELTAIDTARAGA
ncbi:MAG: hypothetical protein AAB074_14645 [Planctomycetota bacterium]